MTTVGRRVRRIEDARLLRGEGRFVDNVDLAGQLWLRVVRSSQAHARVADVDVDAARRAPGVRAVLSARDLGEVPHIPVRLEVPEGSSSEFLQPVLAGERVRYVGEPVAAVLAEDAYGAEDAAELVAVEYDELPVVLDARAGSESDATELRDGLANEAVCLRRRYGDVDGAFAAADHVVELELRVGRHSAVPLEPRGLVAEYDRGRDRLTIWGATKVPHWNRRTLAAMLGMPAARLTMRGGDAGGGFGVRGELYPEDFLVPYLARLTGRPVKWTEDRAEHLVAANHSREQLRSLTAAFDAEHRLVAIRDELWQDNGAYLRTHGAIVAELSIGMLVGPYRVPAYEGTAHVVLTNKTPCGTYRGPGRYEATFARERLLDVAAGELGVDRVGLRRINLLAPEELPHTRSIEVLGHEMVLDAGDYPGLLSSALERSGFAAWVREAEEARDRGRLVGTGIGVFLEKSGGGSYETAAVEVDPSGAVEVRAGGTSLGQGIETVLAQLAADELGVEPATVDVILGDTDLVPDGVGSWASRSTLVGGNAVRMAAHATAAKARRVAAELLEAAPDDLVLARGRVLVAGSAEGVQLGEVAAACDPVSSVRRGEEPGLGARRTFTGDELMAYPYGVHLAQVEVDADTGAVRVLRYFIAYEIGHAVNPTLVDGQLVGGAAQGLGGALMEEFRYDDSGQPLAATFMDYLLPTATEVARVQTSVHEDAPAPGNPLGVMGAGEGGTTGCGAALGNAVADAVSDRASVRALPLAPDRVRRLVRERPAGRHAESRAART